MDSIFTQSFILLATECLLYYNECDEEVRNAMRVLVWSVLDRMVRVKCANLKRSNRLKPINGHELSSA